MFCIFKEICYLSFKEISNTRVVNITYRLYNKSSRCLAYADWIIQDFLFFRHMGWDNTDWI